MQLAISTPGKRSAGLILEDLDNFQQVIPRGCPDSDSGIISINRSLSSSSKVNHSFFFFHSRKEPLLFLEQALDILGVRIYFSFWWCTAVGHLANAGAIPHSRSMKLWSIGILEASQSCRSFIMPRLVCQPADPRAFFDAS